MPSGRRKVVRLNTVWNVSSLQLIELKFKGVYRKYTKIWDKTNRLTLSNEACHCKDFSFIRCCCCCCCRCCKDKLKYSFSQVITFSKTINPLHIKNLSKKVQRVSCSADHSAVLSFPVKQRFLNSFSHQWNIIIVVRILKNESTVSPRYSLIVT